MEEHPNGGEALREEAVSACRREERIRPLLHMENIPSWKLSWAPSCLSLMSNSKIPLGFSGKICSQWVDGSPVRFKLIFWVRKRGETSPHSTHSWCGRGNPPPQKKHSARRSPVLVGRLCNLVTPPCSGECHWLHKMGFIVGRYVNQTTNSRLFGCSFFLAVAKGDFSVRAWPFPELSPVAPLTSCKVPGKSGCIAKRKHSARK